MNSRHFGDASSETKIDTTHAASTPAVPALPQTLAASAEARHDSRPSDAVGDTRLPFIRPAPKIDLSTAPPGPVFKQPPGKRINLPRAEELSLIPGALKNIAELSDFLTQEGEELSPARLTQLARDYVAKADIGKTGACHLFRHTCATLMLEGGADIRYIQEMLGHVELSTTQIYTQVSIRRLKTVHSLTHPSAKIDKPTPTSSTSDVGVVGIPSLAADVQSPLLNTKALEDLAAVVDGDVRAGSVAVKTEAAAAELMAALAAEAAEEGG